MRVGWLLQPTIAQPVEAVCSHLKSPLANLAKRNPSQLAALVKTRLKRLQFRPGPIDGFLAKTGLDLTLRSLSFKR